MLIFFALGNAKVLSFALADAIVPNASSFAFWWNIGFNLSDMFASQLFEGLGEVGSNTGSRIGLWYSQGTNYRSGTYVSI